MSNCREVDMSFFPMFGCSHSMQSGHNWNARHSPWNQLVRLEDMMMDMDRQLSWMERDKTRCMHNPWYPRPHVGQLGYSGPSTESVSGGQGTSDEPNKYALNIHIGGHLTPEDVKVSLKDHVMTVEAKKEYKADDGSSRLYQEFMRKFTLPENVDMKEVKSILTPEGYLKIEAPLPPEILPETKKPQAIPIETQ